MDNPWFSVEGVVFSRLEEHELTASALSECTRCGAIVRRTDIHAEWHNEKEV